MIRYSGMVGLLTRCEGSVLPFAIRIALPCAILSMCLKFLENSEIEPFAAFFIRFKIKGTAYGAFSSLLGFLVVFRTSQAYNRYWIGGGLLQQMTGSWFDAASSLIAFSRMTKAEPEAISRFHHVLIRLFSILNALALVEMQGSDDGEEDMESFHSRIESLDLIDVEGLDKETLAAIKASDNKIELIFHWIQTLVIDHISSGALAVPPPILARAFNELADGMVKFHDCMKITLLPFPFPYSQTTLILLICHWVITPIMICTWTIQPILSGLFSFLVVLTFWSLYAIATELENPFGDDPNDLDAVEMQRSMNAKLLMFLVDPSAKMSPGVCLNMKADEMKHRALHERTCLKSLWVDGQHHENGFVGRTHTATGHSQPVSSKEYKLLDSHDRPWSQGVETTSAVPKNPFSPEGDNPRPNDLEQPPLETNLFGQVPNLQEQAERLNDVKWSPLSLTAPLQGTPTSPPSTTRGGPLSWLPAPARSLGAANVIRQTNGQDQGIRQTGGNIGGHGQNAFAQTSTPSARLAQSI